MVILVTGASSGVGLAVATLLAQKGHRVYGTYRSHKPDGLPFPLLYLDVTSEASIQAAIEELLQKEGRLDALINNAGSGIAGPIELTSGQELAEQMAVNYLGAIAVARAALPALRQSGGRIVATSSLAAFIPIPFQAGYSASKAALEVTLHALALEARPFGVRCTCVQLGDTQTGFTQHRRRVRAAQTDTLYAARFEKSVGKMEADEQNGCPAGKAAAFLVRQLERKNPPPTAACGLSAKAIALLRKLLPLRLVLKIVGKLYS